MIFSAQQIFSEDQAITADAASTNIIDLGTAGTPYGAQAALSRDIGKGRIVPILIQCTLAFDNLTTLDVELQTDDNVGFSSATVVLSMSIALAALVAGAQYPMIALVQNVDERYMRLNYDVVGSNPAAGTITAGIVMGVQTNV